MKDVKWIIGVAFLISACSQRMSKEELQKKLSQLNRIGQVNTFREIIPVGEQMVKEHPACIPLRLELAECYLLTYLVDSESTGLVKAKENLTEALDVDPDFSYAMEDFEKNATFMKRYKEKWHQSLSNKDRKTVEKLLILALIEDFKENSELNLN
jgi:hypothetical protein